MTSVIGILLLVALTVILGAMTAVFALDVGEQFDETPPTAAFDATTEEENVTFAYRHGETIEARHLYVTQGDTSRTLSSVTSVDPDERITAGSRLVVPDTSGETVRLVWRAGEMSSVVATAKGTESGADLRGVEIPPFSRTQYDFFCDKQLNDPFTVQLTVDTATGDPYTGNLSAVEIEVTDHHGRFNVTPETRYYEDVDLSFDENGTTEIVFGNSHGADVDYIGIDVNEITEIVEAKIEDADTTLSVVEMRLLSTED